MLLSHIIPLKGPVPDPILKEVSLYRLDSWSPTQAQLVHFFPSFLTIRSVCFGKRFRDIVPCGRITPPYFSYFHCPSSYQVLPDFSFSVC